MKPDEVKKIRKQLAVNTKGMGILLGVSPRTVESWEQGRYSPSGSAVKMMRNLAIK